MRVTNEQFARALGCLYKSGKAKDQKELATMTGITETTISRIVNDRVKRPSDETIRKLLKVFPDAFDFEETKNDSHLDSSSIFNAIIASKDETIESLKREVMSLQNQLAEKDDHIATLKAHISDLQYTISSLRSSDLKYRSRSELPSRSQKETK